MSVEQITATSVDPEVGGVTVDSRTRRTSTLRRLVRNPMAVTCIVFLAALVAVALLAPVLAPYDQNFTRVDLTNAKPFSGSFVLGGDSSGRDILSRLIWASRGTFLACVVVLVVSVLIGVTAGLAAGFLGGWTDRVSGWLSDVVLALPGTVLLIALYTVIGPSILIAMAVFGLLIAPSFFRLVRAVVTQVRRELYIDAARVSGLSDLRIVLRHVLIAVRAPVIIQSSFVLAAGIGIQAGLEFLGLGNPREASWGGILQTSFASIYQNPGAVVAPTVLISLTTLVLVLLGNALRDVLQVTAAPRPLTRRQRNDLRDRLTTTTTAAPAGDALLAVRDLHIAYPNGDDHTEVVHGIDLDVHRGVIHGLVGESGSGKSQTVFSVLGILPREAVAAGSIVFDGAEILGSDSALRAVRGKRIAYVPQEPMSNLDPTLTVGQQLVVGVRAVKPISRRAARTELLGLLARVGIKDPPAVFDMYPHEISGGMAQRVLITGAIAADPDVILADEPTTALDVTIQADVLDLLREIRDERGLGMVLVTHNLGVVADICDTVSVMRGGHIVETGDVRTVFAAPSHPYTRELLAAATTSTSTAPEVH
ncbi:peptide/nickel transport system permease protein [Curtobacterium sp. PhB137]|uniref:dipeptide/oligopeptide/nickel ABC transporter permease/ATP-binding protein n=1 Tax=unclassified Curtobacterium TaxID=257496 RepID=UPI000F50AC3B|nr:dipeptide/oligopeptide/nickel ABC transporter permease/ATP-binding protein [Curtobacterium sp. PhB137]RPE84722.1 peptide/nickel transport system permease protein [Curtobacterium sp. PhB137]